MLHRLAAREPQARAAVQQRAREGSGVGRLAEVAPPRHARPALAAGRDEAERDRIARGDVVDPFADRLDDPRALVTEDDRVAPVPEVAVGEVQVRVADARRGHADEHLARAGRLELELAHLQRRGVGVQYGRAHPHATRCASSASRSGVTPRPGPGGGAIVPSAAISTTAPPSSQSRRSGPQPGGS